MRSWPVGLAVDHPESVVLLVGRGASHKIHGEASA